MSVMTLDTDTKIGATRHVYAVREQRRRPRRGAEPVGAASSYVVSRPPAVLPARPSRRLLTLATVGFYAVCLGGLAVLVWSVVAGLQPVLVLSFLR